MTRPRICRRSRAQALFFLREELLHLLADLLTNSGPVCSLMSFLAGVRSPPLIEPENLRHAAAPCRAVSLLDCLLACVPVGGLSRPAVATARSSAVTSAQRLFVRAHERAITGDDVAADGTFRFGDVRQQGLGDADDFCRVQRQDLRRLALVLHVHHEPDKGQEQNQRHRNHQQALVRHLRGCQPLDGQGDQDDAEDGDEQP